MRFLLVFSLCLAAFAQDKLLQRDDVKKALAYIQSSHEKTLVSQVTIAEIAAPTFHEGERAKYIAGEFRRLGLEKVEIDPKGNVLGWRPGALNDVFVLAAHLDISFAVGVNVKVRKEGPRWFGPGLGDDSRGLAAMIDIVEAMNLANIKTRRTMLFLANVGEEGLGDLNGVRYLFRQSPYKDRLKAFISLDGSDPGRIVNGGTGVKRYLISLKGPGGHSYGNFGRVNAIHTASRIIDHLADMPVPATPKTTFNVGKITGGTTVNAIAEECSFEIDLRSEDLGILDKIELNLMEAVRLGVEEENKARAASGTAITVEKKLVSNRPGGLTDELGPLAQSAKWASTAMGFQPTFQYGSTDSNIPIGMKVPALTMGGGGKGGDAHSLTEWFEPANAWKGPQTALLTILSFDGSGK